MDKKDFLKHMSCPCCNKVIYVEDLFIKLSELQLITDFNILFNITSGYRCEKHNEDVGGVKNSYHTWGKACDIYIGATSYKDEKVLSFVENAKKVGFRRLGFKMYKGLFVHLDVGECLTHAEW